jgi:cytoskeletal protein RodZ
VTVGEALTEARFQAGLSVDELSQRTRIRQTVIRSIEQDDYDACGGDLYVRGYVRAIAGAVGIDAQPLIREYDTLRAGGAARTAGPQARAAEPDATALDLPPVPAREPDATALDLPPAAKPEADATMLDLPPILAADPAETRFDLDPVTDDTPPPSSLDPWDDPAATRYDLPPVTDSMMDPPADGDLMAAGYDLPPADGPVSASAGPDAGSPPWPSSSRPAPPWPTTAVTGAMQGPPTGPRHGGRGKKNRRLPALAAVVVALVVVAAGLLVDHLASGGTATGRLASAAKSHAATVKSPSAAKAASAQPSAKPTPKPAPPPVTRLPITAAAAFGPDGLADGDNPQVASDAIAPNATTPWSPSGT